MKYVTHPDNLEELRSHLIREAEEKDPPMQTAFGPMFTFPSLFGVEIVTNEHMERRKIEEEWVPPPDDRFVEWEESDRKWQRKLGMGTIVYHDRGPLWYKVNEIRAFLDYGPIIDPRKHLFLTSGF